MQVPTPDTSITAGSMMTELSTNDLINLGLINSFSDDDLSGTSGDDTETGGTGDDSLDGGGGDDDVSGDVLPHR